MRFSTLRAISPFSVGSFGYCSLISRPTIIFIISSFEVSEAFTVPIYVPSRITVSLSAIWKISSIRCVMYIIPFPSERSFRMIVNNFSASFSLIAEVGSSMIIISEFKDIAFAISTSCCSPILKSFNFVAGSTCTSNISRYLRASVAIVLKSTDPPFFFIHLPRKMFSATLNSGTIWSS